MIGVHGRTSFTSKRKVGARCTHAARPGTRVAQTGLSSHDPKAKIAAKPGDVAPERKV